MEKQPTEESLETGGLAVGTRIAIPWAPASAITATPNHVELALPQQTFQAAKGLSLGDSLDHLDHFRVQVLRLCRQATTQQSLMQFPNGIP
jgi:hypothetical protein